MRFRSRCKAFTRLIAVDYFPGEDHTIGRPARYDAMRPHFSSLLGEVASQGDELAIRGRKLFHFLRRITTSRPSGTFAACSAHPTSLPVHFPAMSRC